MKVLDWLDRVFVTAAMGILVVMMCLTTISVFGRYFFGAPIPDDLILSEHLMVFLVFLPLGAVQAARQHCGAANDHDGPDGDAAAAHGKRE